MSATVTIVSLDGDGSFPAYVAEPAEPPRAAIARPVLLRIPVDDHGFATELYARRSPAAAT